MTPPRVKLEPCPMCGHATAPEVDEGFDGDGWSVICSMRVAGCGTRSGYRPFLAEAIAAWNRRPQVPLPEPNAEVTNILEWLKGLEASVRYGLPLNASDGKMIERAAAALSASAGEWNAACEAVAKACEALNIPLAKVIDGADYVSETAQATIGAAMNAHDDCAEIARALRKEP